MIHYTVSYKNPHRHFISFEAKFPTDGRAAIQLHLAAWRPGRYELGNFSKNIRAWKAFDDKLNPLAFKKITKDIWEIECPSLDHVLIQYEYYASELNAGSTFLDDDQLYINPVNCFFYDGLHKELAYQIQFNIPDSHEIACGLNKINSKTLSADNYDQLADSPLIAGAGMKHLDYESGKIKFHIWIQGEVLIDENKFVEECKLFTDHQIKIFGNIPCKEYHFLFHFTSMFQRHGVEHCNSTVIAMGPASDFQFEALYKDLLGISCHELFHTWNVKSIRPIEMMPYDFSRENYTRLGYVTEGVTTYYGDLILWQNGSFNHTDWMAIISENIKTHFDNAGRFNLSVAESSFDTWLDGYSTGIPWRKVSIYNEGFLIALIMDILIMYESDCTKSLDDAMNLLYTEFGMNKKGYTENDYRELINNLSDNTTEEIFTKLVYGKADYTPFLVKVLDLVSLEIQTTPSVKYSESQFGFSVDDNSGKSTVTQIVENSPADKSGLWYGDEIIAIKSIGFGKNFQSLLRMGGNEIRLEILRKNKRKFVTINSGNEIYFKKYNVVAKADFQSNRLSIFWKNRLS